uniref:Furin-like cysteine-rich domain-containing protein n=1 Tax=Onchocerca volvulus TaxID=6282 RepID=A0A8R1TL37_ONCVO
MNRVEITKFYYYRCVVKCDEGYFLEGHKCRACSPNCKTCIKPEQCETCPGTQLLIDVNHYGHLDHGQCVDVCPPELEPDYTIAVQARCVLRRNKCSTGYYEAISSVCTPCDDACRTCHGPGPLQCDSCASNFSNRSVGYCRPCCKAGEDQMLHHCENCGLSSLQVHAVHPSFSRTLLFTLVFLIFCVVVVALIVKIAGHSSSNHNRNIDYAPLPAKEQLIDSFADTTDSDSADEINDKNGLRNP